MIEYFSSTYTVKLSHVGDGHDCIVDISGETVSYEEGDEELVAKSNFLRFDCERSEYPPADLMDHLQNTEPYMALYDGMALSDAVSELIGYEFGLELRTNLFVFDRLEIIPEYRGRGLTSAIFEEAVRLFSAGCDVAALKAFPLQDELGSREQTAWRKSLQLDHFSTSGEKAQRKLADHYAATLGFKALEGTGLMVARIDDGAA